MFNPTDCANLVIKSILFFWLIFLENQFLFVFFNEVFTNLMCHVKSKQRKSNLEDIVSVIEKLFGLCNKIKKYRNPVILQTLPTYILIILLLLLL